MAPLPDPVSPNPVSLSPPAGYTGPRRSLILAGGGMRVAYQAGVLKALAEADLCFHHADGTSGGTINLAMLLSGLSPDAMCARWRTLKVRDFVSFMPFHQYLKAHNLLAMGDADGIVKKVFPHLGIDVDSINAAQGMEGTFNVCNYTRKTNEAIRHDAVDLDLLVAGISLPIFMPPVDKDGTLYIDAVWIKDANCMEAVKRGADELWLVWCIGNTEVYKGGAFDQYVHMIEMSANGALFEEFDRIREVNERIAQGEAPYGHTRPIRLHVIKPRYPLPLDPDLYLGKIDAATLIAMGYADAKQYLRTRTEVGIPFQPEATHMETTNPGISFRETMAGPFALGETDPRAGQEKGKREKTHLAMHASINIRDLDAFVADPNHLGEIHGSIDFTPFGEGIPASHGVFNLFWPADPPDMKYMIYELGFEHEGESYYVAGKKEVHDDPGFDLWADTTTLFTRLHKGTDATGPIVGAGVLTLGVDDLIRLIATCQATSTEATTKAAGTVLKFGRFFLGELWDTYAQLAGRDA